MPALFPCRSSRGKGARKRGEGGEGPQGGAGERMSKTYPVKVKEVDGDLRFYYIEVGKKQYFKTHRIVWVSPRLVKKSEKGEDIVEFPIRAKIVITEKGTIKLVPSDSHLTYDVFVGCGYRGGAKFEVIEPTPESMIEYVEYRSERGSLGVSVGALVTIKGEVPVKIKYHRSGRLYGSNPEGVRVYRPNGDFEDIEVTDVSDLEDVKA